MNRRGWVLGRALAGIVVASLGDFAGVGLPSGSRLASATPSHPVGPDSSLQRMRELEDLRRQDLAAALRAFGVNVGWQEHSLADLVDWRDRIQCAFALRVDFAVYVDWKSMSLAQLTDMRLRAAKAAELNAAFGIRVEWQRYSWTDLESLRRHLAGLAAPNSERSSSPTGPDGLAVPGTIKPRRGRLPHPRDPDAIVEPTFAFDNPLAWSSRQATQHPRDPDAILIPTFAAIELPAPGINGVLDPWGPRSRSTTRGR